MKVCKIKKIKAFYLYCLLREALQECYYSKNQLNFADEYDVVYVSTLGTDPSYPTDKNWSNFADQIINNIEQQAQGRKVIGVGHSLGAVSTLLASFKRPDLFEQVILLDPPLIMGKASFAFDVAKRFFPTPAGPLKI